MPNLSPFAGSRLGRRNHDEEAGADPTSQQQQQPPQSSGSSRWSRPFGRASASGNQHALAVEMSPQPGSSTAPATNENTDLEQGGVHHERSTSGRSIFAGLPSLSTLRQRDRDHERERAENRLRMGDTLTARPYNSFGGAGGNPLAAVMLPQTARTNTAAASRSANKKSRSSRREREEAATLFGPNLANYFGSGISSSGAVSSHGAGIPLPPTAPPLSPLNENDGTANSADPATADGGHPQASASRRARLGSRGRARGASLSGLSMISLGAESVTSLGGVNPERTGDTISPVTGMMQGSTADLIDQLNREGPAPDGQIAMSEGVDITTLQRWIQRSTGLNDDSIAANNTTSATPAAVPGPPVCTTLQSFVNLKRNTLKLSAKPDAVPDSKVPDNDANMLRSRPSLSLLPTLSYRTTTTTSGNDYLPEPTHSLYFEYDCAAPYASVQIFIRASRKHGSWPNQPASINGADPLAATTNGDGSPAWLAQAGPPPHVLGWPVHVAKLKKGFGAGHTANIPLHLQYYAPPKAKKGEEKEAAVATKPAPEPPTPIAIPETPGFEFHRQLQLDNDDADDDAAAQRGPRPGRSASNAVDTQPGQNMPAPPIEGAAAQPVVAEEETKEQRLAREKAERETLKVAIVVEALDENARPLREPNLQTSYLRLTSLPAKKSVADRLAELATAASADVTGTPAVSNADVEPPRTWSSQVEGQEAEIGPHRFQLQELYGLSSKPPAVAPAPPDAEGDDDGTGTAGAAATMMMDADASNGSECLICLSSPPTTLLLPCTHGLCLECAVQLRDSIVGIRQSERRRGRTPRRKYACPVCRRAYTSMLHLSKADEKVLAQTTEST